MSANEKQMSHMYRGPNQKDNSQENRWFVIMDYLDNLKTFIEDKAKDIGDNLIREEAADEEKRLRKIEIENQ